MENIECGVTQPQNKGDGIALLTWSLALGSCVQLGELREFGKV